MLHKALHHDYLTLRLGRITSFALAFTPLEAVISFLGPHANSFETLVER